VAALVLWRQRQASQGPHRPLGAQHRAGQLEKLIASRGQAPVKVKPEPR